MKHLSRQLSYCCIVLILLLGNTALAADSSSKKAPPKSKDAKQVKSTAPEVAKPEAAKKPTPSKPLKVKKGPFSVEVELQGVFEAKKSEEITLRPRRWSDLTVLKAVAHGTRVKRGDLLIALETEKLDQSIADLQTECRLGQLSIQEAEVSLKALEKSTPMNLKAADRALRMAEEDLKWHQKIEGPMSRKSTESSLTISRESLEYAEEEVKQLEKMYKADGLTEETEEIVLKRARNSVRRSRLSFEQAKKRYEYSMKYSLPRRDTSVQESTQRQHIGYLQQKINLPLALTKQRIALAKLKVSQDRKEKQLEELKADRLAMVVKSPTEGVVYYGRFVRGKWSGASSLADKLCRKGKLSPNQVVMTILKPQSLSLRASVPEKNLCQVRAGLQSTVCPTGYPELKLKGIVASVDSVPTVAGDYQLHMTLAADKRAEPIMPAMTCTIKLVTYQNKHAIVVPASALITEGSKQFVRVVGKDGKPQKRAVTVGKRNKDRVEITKGLSEGEQITLESPKPKK